MDPETGKIIRENSDFIDALELQIRAKLEEQKKNLIPLTEDEAKTCENMGLQQRKGWMRNKPCLCGSGKKFKNCCWNKG